MKRILICAGLALASTFTLSAQMMSGKPHKAPLSPPAKAMASFNGKAVSITYSSPRVRGRQGNIFTPHGLISHDAQNTRG